jgi:hypothetical protein
MLKTLKTSKIMKTQFLALCCISILLCSCGGGNKAILSTPVDKSDSVIKYAEEGANNANHKISLKSVIIHMKSTAMGLTQQIVIYMEDYGNKQTTEVTQELMGKKVTQISINDGEWVYSYSPQTKKGQKTKVNMDNPDNINFNAITKEMADKFKLKKTGTAKILDRPCDVYSLEYAKAKLKGTFYIWKGIPLKTESEVSVMKVVMEATQIEENITISPDKFTVPKDIVFTEGSQLPS